MKFNEVHIFSSEDYPSEDIAPMVRPCVEDLHIWFTKKSAYILVNGWREWKPGMSIAEVLRG
jgi:hypothetical protein